MRYDVIVGKALNSERITTIQTENPPRPAYSRLFDRQIIALFRDAWRITLKDPSLAPFFLRAARDQQKAARRRQAWEKKGVHVPPLLIASVTNRCNLNCKGCYAHALSRTFHRVKEEELKRERLQEILQEANKLGISIVMLAGGEPLVRRDLMEVTALFPEIVFPLFTNGLLIDDFLVQRFQAQKNVVPVISLEGYAEDTDERRGKGVYAHLRKIISRMEGRGIFLGVSLTVTGENYDLVTEESFLGELVSSGARVFFFVEYVPVEDGTDHLLLSQEQRLQLRETMVSMRKKLPGLFIAFPGDEAEFGGCLSAGRGFVHLSPSGALEPCPFAPYSDASLEKVSLEEALKSNFLQAIRENHEKLSEMSGGCALWANRDWVRSLLPPLTNPR
jgi:MoaA/NifB/PqqE/SkfB family radical SAM enzyme